MLKKAIVIIDNEETYALTKAFLPDMNIIKLGTNNTESQNWKYS